MSARDAAVLHCIKNFHQEPDVMNKINNNQNEFKQIIPTPDGKAGISFENKIEAPFSSKRQDPVVENRYLSYLSRLAQLLEYPRDEEAFLNIIGALNKEFIDSSDEFKKDFDRFVNLTKDIPIHELEEKYTATFDLNPVCSLYISVHLFGEDDYRRGKLMAGLKDAYQKRNFQPENDLPDYLPTILRYLTYADETERNQLIYFCLLNALEKILKTIGKENPYFYLFSIINGILLRIFPERYEVQPGSYQSGGEMSACGALSACGARCYRPYELTD